MKLKSILALMSIAALMATTAIAGTKTYLNLSKDQVKDKLSKTVSANEGNAVGLIYQVDDKANFKREKSGAGVYSEISANAGVAKPVVAKKVRAKVSKKANKKTKGAEAVLSKAEIEDETDLETATQMESESDVAQKKPVDLKKYKSVIYDYGGYTETVSDAQYYADTKADSVASVASDYLPITNEYWYIFESVNLIDDVLFGSSSEFSYDSIPFWGYNSNDDGKVYYSQNMIISEDYYNPSLDGFLAESSRNVSQYYYDAAIDADVYTTKITDYYEFYVDGSLMFGYHQEMAEGYDYYPPYSVCVGSLCEAFDEEYSFWESYSDRYELSGREYIPSTDGGAGGGGGCFLSSTFAEK